MKQKAFGTVLAGSVSAGLTIKVAAQNFDNSKLFVGALVCIREGKSSYFSSVADLGFDLDQGQQGLIAEDYENNLFGQFCKKFLMSMFVKVRPMLLLEGGVAKTVKSLPGQGTDVFLATQEDVQTVFGRQTEDSTIFSIGSPLGLEASVCIDLEAVCSRSVGIFGRTGTGKTFVTKNLLYGIIERKVAVCLIFDMHAEYAFSARAEGGGFVPGLKDFFPSSVACFSLDSQNFGARGISADCQLTFGLNQITVADIAILADELNLHPTAVEVAYSLKKHLGANWLSRLLEFTPGELKEVALACGAHLESANALARKLRQIERFSFIKKHSSVNQTEQIVQTLSAGKSVVLEFGRCSSMLAYLLVSSIVTREIHKAWVEKSETFVATRRPQDQPNKLVIVLEEAHKFLSPAAAKQTIFGMIAREMRKYFVTLLIVDQRPSSIDQDVLSQISTKFVSQLGDERDISAAIVGTPNGQELKTIISTLAPKQEMVVFGFATPMPIALRIKNYGAVAKKEPFNQEVAIDSIYG